jgi:LmbE family N-acetylglucosaminyl deacetylase
MAMHYYEEFVQRYAELLKEGKQAPMGGFAPGARAPISDGAAKVLIFSPHPDDECIIGALPLRLFREAKMRVINVAVTQGSKKERQAERFSELVKACEFMGFGLIQTAPAGLEKVNAKTRESDPAFWAKSVETIRQILEQEKPRVIFFPHLTDWNSSHIGTHHLVMDALAKFGSSLECYLVETEYWGQNPAPNLMVESSAADVADMVAGTSFHVGEVSRNPFHLFLPAWMQDNVRRGSELVGGQGEAAPDFTFATLYRLRRWSGGKVEEVFSGGRKLPAHANPADLFP